MKYLFLALLFWLLGYVTPTFPPFLQLIIAGLAAIFTVTNLFLLLGAEVQPDIHS